jgi:undecaprenyl pyrophosphate synthase
MNNLSHMAIAAEFISNSNIKLIQQLLKEHNCSQLSLFLKTAPANFILSKNDFVQVSIFPSNTARETSLERVRTAILAKKLSTENNALEFTEEEVSKIFARNPNAEHFDLIILASASQNSLANNFIIDANYAEFYLSSKIYNKDFFDISEIRSAIQIYENSQRNFGS